MKTAACTSACIGEAFDNEIDPNEPPHFVDQFITQDVLKPKKTIRKYLARMWNTTDPDAQIMLRSNRAHVGIKCNYCGSVGYFQENCPNGCANRPPTPDSDDSPPPSPPPPSIGILWNVPKSTREQKSKARTNRINVSKLKEDTISEAMRLEESDKQLHSYDFFQGSEHGYNRSLPEMTLHQVMRKLMRILKSKIKENVINLEAAVDQTLLLPSNDALDTPDYPEKLKRYKEYRAFFLQKLAKADVKKRPFDYQGSLRPVDSLDPYFRVERPGQLDLFTADPKAGSSMHSRVGWKSILATGDSLAVSDPAMAMRIREVEEMCSKQGQWVPMQKASMKRKNDHFEHCAYILRQEMSAEHVRESRILQAGKSMSTKERAAVWQQRLTSADRLMSTISLYGLSSGFDEADYLVYNLQKWKEECQRKLFKTNSTDTSSSTASTITLPLNNIRKSGKGGGTEVVEEDESTISAATEASTIIESIANPYGMEAMRITNDLRARGVLQKTIKPKSNGGLTGFGKCFLAGVANDDEGKTNDNASTNSKSDSKGNKKVDSKKSGAAKTDGSNKERNKTSSAAATKSKISNAEDAPNNGTKPSDDSNSDSSVRSDEDNDADEGVKKGDDDDDDEEDDEETLTSSVARSIARAKKEAAAIARKEEIESAKRKKNKKNNFIIVHKRHQRDIDQETMTAEKEKYRNAGLERNIRTGKDTDVAYLAPTLIPVPGTFEGEKEGQQLSSYVGQNIIRKIRTSLVRTDIGYTPQQLLPLYVRNTLIENNGTTPGGDQNAQVMAKDRRYSHYIGRPLNRFEPDKDLISLASMDVNELGLKIKKENPNKELTERQKEKLRKKKLAMQNMPISNAFIKMEFTKLPTLADLYHKDELLCEND